MKFSEMVYERPHLANVKKEMQELVQGLEKAECGAEAKKIFMKMEQLNKYIETQSTIAQIRHSINTLDPFYDQETAFWDEAEPQLEAYSKAWDKALLESRFRTELEEEFGSLLFQNLEISQRTFSPEIIPALQKENQLVTEYEKLLASAQIPFEGGTYTLSQMTPFKNDPDDARRLSAWKAEGSWYAEHGKELDDLFDQLVQVRDEMGRKLGGSGFTALGYDRMERNCYGKENVETFRQAVVRHVVPVAEEIFRQQAERLGKTWPMNFADNALMFRSGNPKPKGSAEEILAAGKMFYEALSPQTGEFFRMMLDNELMDVLSVPGKEGGGYCTSLPDYGVPFIFANFNGTQGDVEVVTHEAGHAFAAWLNRDRVPYRCIWPGMEACEVHSMSMEFFSWPWAEEFFGEDADKFRYSHLAGALTFIPYGTMVDHFQHIIYEKPHLTPAERHEVWKTLMKTYMPWMKLDGEIPFYGEGKAWQRQQHIYSDPFYYIDYCLAQTVSLQFWAMLQKDPEDAWNHYMAYAKQGGSRTFTELLAHAGLQSPLEERTLQAVCRQAKQWLDSRRREG